MIDISGHEERGTFNTYYILLYTVITIITRYAIYSKACLERNNKLTTFTIVYNIIFVLRIYVYHTTCYNI